MKDIETFYEHLPDQFTERMGAAIADLRVHYDVFVMGPTPRPRIDGSAVWETTPAFRLERRLADILRGDEREVNGGHLIAVGPGCARVREGKRGGTGASRTCTVWNPGGSVKTAST
ncbi:hypothetical protein FJT64_018843 [Amphibalanus amphitrite]|uniref:Uncharacterized protein n=1 Tax=Amphibalanus amphitrite TaxID=1232801 RepID=A0A6A4X6Y9_AMPAM|nr:hypothetical protein FJT64_018843 [Amphibalanus amphitrite]